MPGDKDFIMKPIKKETHEMDITWVLEQLKVSIPDLNNQTGTEIILEQLKKIIAGKPDEFYSSLEITVREQIQK